MLTVILTGGSSRRMGRDKALLPFEGETLLETLVKRYRETGPVAVSVDRSRRFPVYGAGELVDPFPGQGPMNGIVEAFRETEAEVILLTAVDLPYGDPALAAYLGALRGDSDVCLVRRGPKGIEPLFAVYGRSCLPIAEECMQKGRRSVMALLDRVKVRYVTPEELSGFDLERIFTNVNTPEEYERRSADIESFKKTLN